MGSFSLPRPVASTYTPTNTNHSGERREAATPENYGPIVSVLTWIMAAAVLLAVGVKIALSSALLKSSSGIRIAREDVFLIFALALSIGYTAAVSIAATHGLAERQDDDTANLNSQLAQKATYVAGALMVLIEGTTQAAILSFLNQITPSRNHHMFILALAGFDIVLQMGLFLAALTSCTGIDDESSWQVLSGVCSSRQQFLWTIYGILNILMEIALIALPLAIVLPLTMARGRKSIVLTGFAARLLVVGALIALVYEVRLPGSLSWPTVLAGVFVQGISIITVCIPYIRNLLLGIESGMIQTGHFRLPQANASDEAQSSQDRTMGSDAMGTSSKRRGRSDSAVRKSLFASTAASAHSDYRMHELPPIKAHNVFPKHL